MGETNFVAVKPCSPGLSESSFHHPSQAPPPRAVKRSGAADGAPGRLAAKPRATGKVRNNSQHFPCCGPPHPAAWVGAGRELPNEVSAPTRGADRRRPAAGSVFGPAFPNELWPPPPPRRSALAPPDLPNHLPPPAARSRPRLLVYLPDATP